MWRRRNAISAVVCLIGTAFLVFVQRNVPEPAGGILVSLAFFGMVLVAGILGGWKFGFVATTLGFLAAMFLFSHPYFARVTSNFIDVLRLVSFTSFGGVLSVVCEVLHRAWRRIEDRQHELENEVDERRKAQAAEQARADELMAILSELQRGQAALRESERRYRAIGESIDYGTWVSDSTGHNTYASDSFLRLIGLSQQQLSDLGPGAAMHPDDAMATIAAWNKCVHSGGRLDCEHRIKGVDGQWHAVLTRGIPVRNEQGDVTSWVGINLDISRLKQVEAELRDEDRRKDEFLATLAHELRNPLAPIVNALQILKMPNVDAESAQQTRQIIERQVHHLSRLVDDLLDVSRVMRGKIDLRKEPVDLSTVIGRAIETVQPLINAQGHRVSIDCPSESLLLHADPVRLAQVVGNLLTNAAKYTHPKGHIRLSANRHENEAILSIRDDGIGIDPDMLTHIFELFVQLDHSSDRSHGGLGIGLTLVKNLVELHGGTVEAASDGLGRGCEFTVRLPLSSKKSDGDDRHVPVVQADRPTPESNYRLLVVDDNQDAAISLSLVLRLQGHDVRVAHDGPSALEIARTFAPDMIFLDLGMPGMDGYEVARRVRKTPGLETTVLAALTGWGQEEDRLRSAEAGFDLHLVKPFEPKELVKLLAALPHLRQDSSTVRIEN